MDQETIGIPVIAGNIAQIRESAGIRFRDESEIPGFVESPLVPAVTELFKKGILTISSSANVEEGRDNAHILIDWQSLSEVNKQVATKILGSGKVHIGPWGEVTLSMPIKPDTPTEQISQWANEIAQQFVLQPAIWETRYSLDQMGKLDESLIGLKPSEISQKIGYFFGDDGFFYRDEAAYKRYRLGAEELPQAHNK